MNNIKYKEFIKSRNNNEKNISNINSERIDLSKNKHNILNDDNIGLNDNNNLNNVFLKNKFLKDLSNYKNINPVSNSGNIINFNTERHSKTNKLTNNNVNIIYKNIKKPIYNINKIGVKSEKNIFQKINLKKSNPKGFINLNDKEKKPIVKKRVKSRASIIDDINNENNNIMDSNTDIPHKSIKPLFKANNSSLIKLNIIKKSVNNNTFNNLSNNITYRSPLYNSTIKFDKNNPIYSELINTKNSVSKNESKKYINIKNTYFNKIKELNDSYFNDDDQKKSGLNCFFNIVNFKNNNIHYIKGRNNISNDNFIIKSQTLE